MEKNIKFEQNTPLWDNSLSIEERLDYLTGAMTLEEKIHCLTTGCPDIPRLGIRATYMGGEAAHGIEARHDQAFNKGEPEPTTAFTQPIGMSASFDRELIRECGRAVGEEARALYTRNGGGGLCRWAPTIDMERDPRWGRTEESYGEDPYLTGEMAGAYIRGMRGEDPFYIRCGATLKHFYANNVEKDRIKISSSVDRRNKNEYYLKPFKKAIMEGGAEAVMTSYNEINGIPAIVNDEVRHVLKGTYGLPGHVVCDGGDFSQTVNDHHFYQTHGETLANGLKAGVDCFTDDGELVYAAARKALDNGWITEKDIDESVRNSFRTRIRLGMFDKEGDCPYQNMGEEYINNEEHQELARKMAAEAVVLLKNEKLLPLSRKKKVIWAGPYTASRELLSRWSIFGEHEAVETIEDVLQKKQIEAECITGCNILSDAECKVWQVEQELSDKPRDEQWLETITHEDTVVCVLGEHESQSGEAASRAFLTLPEEQQVLFEKIAERTSNIVTVVITGRPLDLRRISERSKAVIMAWRPGTMGAEAIIDIVYGRLNPSGKLSVSIPWCVGQVPISYWDVKTGHIFTEDNSENRFISRYMDIPNTPLYPFGYGLSYTEFDISDIDVQIGQDKKVHIHCNVCNTGSVAGAEVVQCYYETLYASVVRPKKELVRFRKVFLEPGEKKDVDFFIDQEEFSYYGKNMETVSSGMKLRISIGNSSDHLVSENIIQA